MAADCGGRADVRDCRGEHLHVQEPCAPDACGVGGLFVQRGVCVSGVLLGRRRLSQGCGTGYGSACREYGRDMVCRRLCAPGIADILHSGPHRHPSRRSQGACCRPSEIRERETDVEDHDRRHRAVARSGTQFAG